MLCVIIVCWCSDVLFFLYKVICLPDIMYGNQRSKYIGLKRNGVQYKAIFLCPKMYCRLEYQLGVGDGKIGAVDSSRL